MVGDKSICLEQNSSTNAEVEEVITVSFPYSVAEEIEVTPLPKAAPTLKIDYTAIEIPAPKKTINLRRSVSETRLIRLTNSLSPETNSPKSVENSPPISIKSSFLEPSAKNDDLAETMQKLLKNVGTISLAAQESQRQYAFIATSLEKQSSALPKLDALQKHLEQSHKVETANQRLFNVMHGELQGYKDNFLFEALQKPVIRDLLALFDDLCGQTRRIDRFLTKNSNIQEGEVAWKPELQASHDNLNNTVFYIIEVLNRLDVNMLDSSNTILDLKVHKVVGVEPTDNEDEKNHIVRVVRPGFLWKDRIIRPTEVIIKKYGETIGKIVEASGK